MFVIGQFKFYNHDEHAQYNFDDWSYKLKETELQW
jgi:hypothetical protein